jgi:hypothetical protein
VAAAVAVAVAAAAVPAPGSALAFVTATELGPETEQPRQIVKEQP